MAKTVKQQNNEEILTNAFFMGISGAIEITEAVGQKELINSDVLPTKCDIEKLTKLGVVFGDQVENDDLFRYVVLPAGWKKVPTDHSMWSKLVDSEGNEIASIFYKASSYDRKAHMCVE